MSGRGRLAMILVAGLVGCAPAAGPGSADDAAQEMIPSLDVKVEGDSVRMTLHVMSVLDTPLVLEFPSAQRADFSVLRPDGETVWTWSANRSFAQVTGSETLAAGGTLDFTAAWAPALPGRYEAVARLVSTNRPVQVTVPFEVP